MKFTTYDMVQNGIFQYFGLIRCNIFTFLKGSLIMSNFNFWVDMRLFFLMPVLMNSAGLWENVTVTAGRETPLFIA